MRCPFCGEDDTKVVDSRIADGGDSVRRRRTCGGCGERFTTFETPELVMPRIIKNSGVRVPFDEEKLRRGIMRALEKRAVEIEKVNCAIHRINHRIRATGDREVSSRLLGEWVMEELRLLDEVAYVRFASVYRSFQDINAFQEEIDRMQHDAPSSAQPLPPPEESKG
ncbi:MAG: transcriptional regulator NrdR [Gammaproteobacteria bacterium]|nr:transcriptional regulator NrdR [Gammaproteobacteria bacterium]